MDTRFNVSRGTAKNRSAMVSEMTGGNSDKRHQHDAGVDHLVTKNQCDALRFAIARSRFNGVCTA